MAINTNKHTSADTMCRNDYIPLCVPKARQKSPVLSLLEKVFIRQNFKKNCKSKDCLTQNYILV